MGVRSTSNHPLTTKADGHLLEYFRQNFGAGGGAASPIIPQGITATGGIISDYNEPGGDVYRSHVFTTSGEFDVTALGTFGNTVDYLVVAGGGGGSDRGNGCGGGGAGGLLSSHPDVPSPRRQTGFTAAIRTYTMTVGAGGLAGAEGVPSGPRLNRGENGSSSSITYPGPNTVVTTTGGGAGGQGNTGGAQGSDGGSGGGSDNPASSGGAGTNYPGPTQQGFPGGNCNPPQNGGGGGGGAGGAGGDCNGTSGSAGGIGLRVRIAGPLNDGVGAPGPGSEFAWFAGGGGGGRDGTGGGEAAGGYGGGGNGAYNPHNSPRAAFLGRFGLAGTGGGGGSGADGNDNDAGSGGSGVIIVRYKIASIDTAKATGGSVSFYNNKTIHTFTSSGTFATTSDWSAANVEYIVIGGGGGGGFDGGGGGGAGTWREGTTPIGAHPVSTTIQIGAGGIGSLESQSGGSPGIGPEASGSPSYFGTPITAPGGGGGGGGGGQPGAPGGSGGGGRGGSSTGSAGSSTGDDFPGTPGPSPSNGWGSDGGDGSNFGGGGGGTGGTGFDGDHPTPSLRGVGGLGAKLPATFTDPISTVGYPGPSSGRWLAGGGGGGSYPLVPAGVPGGGPGGPYAGAGDGQGPDPAMGGTRALANSGSGGGGGTAGSSNPNGRHGADGGSGIVLIAYPT